MTAPTEQMIRQVEALIRGEEADFAPLVLADFDEGREDLDEQNTVRYCMRWLHLYGRVPRNADIAPVQWAC